MHQNGRLRPRVGVAILNYKRPDLTIDCLDHLRKVDWPEDRLEIVVVDNDSGDDSVERISLAHPGVKVVRSPRNRGFAGGSNLAIKSMGDVDYIALLNNDAMVEQDWLAPLVEALESDPQLGAASPKILFTATYVDILLESAIFRPVGIDPRDFGIRVSGAMVGTDDRYARCHFPSGFWPPMGSTQARWTNGRGVLRMPFSEKDAGEPVRLRLSAEATKRVEVSLGEQNQQFEITNMPMWFEVNVCVTPVDMINNVGSDLVEGKNSADRGIFQLDCGQFDRPEPVFAWCGCAVVLSKRYLDDVGLFDERFFLYYEDFDLSWRGQRRGWKYAYVPQSIVRHYHASTTGEHSDLFNFYVWRNRLLVLAKNAPAAVALREAASFVMHVYRHVRLDLPGDGLSPTSKTLLKALGSFVAHSPAAFAGRAAIGLRNRTAPLAKRSGHA